MVIMNLGLLRKHIYSVTKFLITMHLPNLMHKRVRCRLYILCINGGNITYQVETIIMLHRMFGRNFTDAMLQTTII